jgi:4-coumarate--CoA ligase (photoactive yellow protein activation family)
MMSGRIQWWQPEALERFVCDLLAGELTRLRPGQSPPAWPWSRDARLEADLGVDSLERVHLATALAEAIHLSRSGIEDSLLAGATLGDWLASAARSLAAYSDELTFKTSGSTGQPKWCVHRLPELVAEVEDHALALGDVRRVVSAVPSHHIYGFLFTVLLPGRVGVEVIDVRAHSPARLAGLVRAGDLVVAHPDYWSAFVRAVPAVIAGATGVTSTAPCPAATARAVVERGFTRLVEIYGSSETAGVGRRADPDAAFELLSFWRRGASDGELVRGGPDGERRVPAPDFLIWEDDRHVRPAGRTEGAVQVGGTNVFPARIAAALGRHPGVAAAAVRLMRPDEGTRLKAFIVPAAEHPDLPALQRDLTDWIDSNLSVPERPKSIVFGSELPTGALGKISDWPITPP